MKKLHVLFILLPLMTVAYSCNVVKLVTTIQKMKKKHIEYEKVFTKDNQEVLLVGITHYGKKQFYNNLRDSIISWKSQGYRMYYEEIDSKIENGDSTKANYYNRKWRRVNGGFNFTREEYEETLDGFVKNGMVQPEWVDLGITDTDLNADVYTRDIVHEYERLYGEIKLSQCDLDTPLRGEGADTYDCAKALKHDQQPVILDFRNKKLVERVRQEQDPKIAVIYGANHMKGMKKLLKAK